MLRIWQSTSISDAKSYYTEALKREDYYGEDREIFGSWGGRSAERLGLAGGVTRDPFARLCENIHPATGGRLTPRTRDDRTVGYDLNFHAPKGVSVVHALTGDERIVGAFRDAVDQTMLEIERATHTRVRLPGTDGVPRSEDRHTGNLVWGSFVHGTTRPAGTLAIPDPQLHVHCFVMNATFDGVEHRWKAGQFRHIVRDHPYYEAAFHARFAGNMQSLGYGVTKRDKYWDLAGVPEELISAFSNRTREIEAIARRDGITDPEAKSALGARSRRKKDASLSEAELRRLWDERLTEEHREWVRGAASGTSVPVGGDGDPPRVRTPAEAVDHAIAHTFERKSVESVRRVEAEALRFAMGRVTPEAVRAELMSRSEVLTKTLPGDDVQMTLRGILEEERSCVRFAEEGLGTCLPLGNGYGGREGDRYAIGSGVASKGITPNESQRNAVEFLLSSRDRVMLVRGGAGTGKTQMLIEAARGIREGGSDILACSVNSRASRQGLKEAGFEKPETLQLLLTSQAHQDRLRGQVLLIDEAGLVGSRQFKQVCDLSAKTGCRVIMVGDPKQHQPIERGDAMRLLMTQAGLRPAEVTEIVRQKGIYKEAIQALQEGELTKSVELFDQMGAIKEIKPGPREHREAGHDRRVNVLADRYEELTRGRKTAVVVSPTHADGQRVTDAIRATLKDTGRLDSEGERTCTRLKDTQWSHAQKQDIDNYREGQWVQLDQHITMPTKITPARKGLRMEIVGIDKSGTGVTARDAAGELRFIGLKDASKFTVYTKQEIAVAPGDRVRFTKNDRDVTGRHRLSNGVEYAVRGFTERGHLKLSNGWEVRSTNMHANHGYCTTPQVAQGVTAHSVLASFSGEATAAAKLNSMYVIMSRAKERAEAYVENRPDFIKAVGRMHTELMASDITGPTEKSLQQHTDERLAHAREVARLKAHEQTVHRQKAALRGLGKEGRGQLDRSRQQPQQQHTKRQDRGQGPDRSLRRER